MNTSVLSIMTYLQIHLIRANRLYLSVSGLAYFAKKYHLNESLFDRCNSSATMIGQKNRMEGGYLSHFLYHGSEQQPCSAFVGQDSVSSEAVCQ